MAIPLTHTDNAAHRKLLAQAANNETTTWTPAITFATAGDLSVAYTTQTGHYTEQGESFTLTFDIVTSSFTHTTASGNLRITGMPADKLPINIGIGAVEYGGITRATHPQVTVRTDAGADYLRLAGSGSGVAVTAVSASHMPTGGSVVLRGTITYFV